MRNKTFFSVVIPVYNSEKYLKECLDSVLEQSFSDYEIILVDDGSTDSSGKICDDFVLNCPEKIRVIHNANSGPLLTRQAGVKLSNGEYIYIMDSDDRICKELLEKVYAVIVKHRPDMVCIDYKRINKYGAEILSKKSKFFVNGFIPLNEFRQKFSLGLINTMWSKIIKKDCININADYISQKWIYLGEDMLQGIDIIDHISSVYYIDEQLYEYRSNPESIVHTFKPDNLRCNDYVYSLVYDRITNDWGIGSEDFINEFFSSYLKCICGFFVGCMNNCTAENAVSVLSETLEYRLVKLARNYLDKSNLSPLRKIGLRLYYEKKWKRLKIYSWAYRLARKILKNE